MNNEKLLKFLRVVVCVGMPMLLLFKIYNLVFYIPFGLCALYIAIQNYRAGKLQGKKGIPTGISIALILLLFVLYRTVTLP